MSLVPCLEISLNCSLISDHQKSQSNLAQILLHITSWKPVLRTEFLWTCWGLNKIKHHMEVMHPHIPVFTIVNPSLQSFLINLLPYSVTHYINTSGSFPGLPYFLAMIIVVQFPIYHSTNPVPAKMCQFVPQWSMKHEIVFTSKGNLHMIPGRCSGIYLSGVKNRRWTVSEKYPTTV
jgi:hypothetical protein